jgi:hypothetical protein
MTDPSPADHTPADVERAGGPHRTRPPRAPPAGTSDTTPGGVEGVGPISADMGEDSGALDEHAGDTTTRPDASP